jgi:hypothetical protein
MKSIDHHNSMILANVLAPFLTADNTKKEALETFYKSTRFIAEEIADTINQHVIPDLVNINFSKAKMPKLRARRIGEWEDMRTMSFTLRNLVGANLIRPDDEMEKFLRREMDVPPIDEATIREVLTPQMPGSGGAGGAGGAGGEGSGGSGTPTPPKAPKAGPPRQAPAKAKANRSNTGTDKSGGK